MKYEYWLAMVNPLSNRKKYFLREHVGSAENIFYIEETKLRELKFLKDKEIYTIMQAQKGAMWQTQFDQLEQNQIQFLPSSAKRFPDKLRHIPDPPFALFVKGELPAKEKKAVAIVGARACTAYGEKYALEYGEELAKQGLCVISGLARGIDGMGQRGALRAGGSTYAVLGCGADVCYPKEHMGLYVDILQNKGGIISEYAPGTQPASFHFPQRNRIISGLADMVLVMEAREKSGSLITADMALEQGKDVYALPGPVNSSLSLGCNQLIRQGAGILLSPDMLLEEMGISVANNGVKSDKNKIKLDYHENMLYSRLDLFPTNISQIFGETQLPADQLLESLVSLEIKGYIREVSKNHYVKLK